MRFGTTLYCGVHMGDTNLAGASALVAVFPGEEHLWIPAPNAAAECLNSHSQSTWET